MSDAEQFMAAVPERSVPRDWRGGLERSGARQGRGGRQRGRRRGMNSHTALSQFSIAEVAKGFLGRSRMKVEGRATGPSQPSQPHPEHPRRLVPKLARTLRS